MICTANQVTGFCMKCNSGLKWVNKNWTNPLLFIKLSSLWLYFCTSRFRIFQWYWPGAITCACMCMLVCAFVCVYVRTWAFSSECKIDQVDFTDLTFRGKSTVIPNPSVQIPKAFHQHGLAEKTKIIQVWNKCFNIADRIVLY